MRGWALLGLLAWLGICSTALARAPCRVGTVGTGLRTGAAAWKSPAGCMVRVGIRLRVTVVGRTGFRSARTARRARVALAAEAVPPRSAIGFPRRALLRQARRRTEAIRRIARAANVRAAALVPLYRALLVGGARVLRVSTTAGTITAWVPRRVLNEIAERRDVDAIEPSLTAAPLNLGVESSAVGATTWWTAGYSGGRGLADIPANFAVDQDPVLHSHPAFTGITFETPPGAVQQDSPSITRHGTALLSMAAAQGPAGCSLCQPADADEKGVAPRVGKVLDPSGAGAETDWAAGIPYYWYDNDSGTWKLQPGASDPAQVINFSRGNDANYDDSIGAQEWDATVDSYGVTATVAAGNSGPASHTINDPALAYNVIGVGAFSGGGTTDPGDDSIFTWSSRGPTVGGRKKPDLVAVGDGGLAYSYYQSTGKLWKYDTGTSYAAPQVGGGAILLAGAGIRDPKVVKAILIDSARQGRVTAASAMGTQTGWQPDWGWGELNLDAAYKERLNFARGDVPANGARFFRADALAPGDRATLVWNRRVADCQPLRQGCYYDTTSGFRVYTLSNLDLSAYDAATAAPLAASTSAVDNVEQVRVPAPGSVVYKVSAGDVDGPAGEPFAVAATRPLTPLTTPQPTIALDLSTRGTIAANAPVSVTATITNPSPELPADNATATLTLPAGVELVAGQQTQPLGTLGTKGTTTDHGTARWTIRGTTHGLKQLVAGATATKYGSTFRSSATGVFTVDAQPPTVTIAVPATPADPGAAFPVRWSASEPATFDVDVAEGVNAYARWLTATNQTAATYAGSPGGVFRFRVRATDVFGNTSPFVESDAATVARVESPLPPPAPENPVPASRSPQLRIASIRRTKARIVVMGTVARGASGEITAIWRRGARRIARAGTRARRGRFTLSLKAPQSASGGTLVLQYGGGRGFAAQTLRLAIRTR